MLLTFLITEIVSDFLKRYMQKRFFQTFFPKQILSVPEYTYQVRRVLYSDYRLKQEIPMPNSEGRICERLIKKRYAVRMEFHQGGKIGM